MKLEGLHGNETARHGRFNLDSAARKKSTAACHPEPRRRRGTSPTEFGAHKITSVIEQLAGGPSLHSGSHRVSLSYRDHFPQHSQAITKKTDLATLGVVPTHRNFTDAQSGMLREVKQLDIESETIEAGGLQNRAAYVEAKSLEPALRIPKWQPSRDADEQVERATSLLTSPRLMDANQPAIQGA